MYFFELIKTCDKETMIQDFLKKVSDSSKTHLLETHLRKALKCIDETKPNKNDNCIICIDKYTNEEEVCDDVYMLDKSNSEKYALEINPWADTLGYLVDSDSVSKYGKEKFSALVLWDMTWFGYDNEKIQAEVRSWKDETNFISYDEIKELLKP